MSDPVIVKLDEFLRVGELGPVRVGISRDEVLRTLGEPERLGGMTHHHPQAPVWKYGDIELHFDPDTTLLALVYADGFEVPRGALGLEVDPAWLRGGLPLDTALTRLAEAELGSTMRIPDYDPGHAVLELESGVLLGFNVEGSRAGGRTGLVFFSQGPR